MTKQGLNSKIPNLAIALLSIERMPNFERATLQISLKMNTENPRILTWSKCGHPSSFHLIFQQRLSPFLENIFRRNLVFRNFTSHLSSKKRKKYLICFVIE
jgi:hypothetical protein